MLQHVDGDGRAHQDNGLSRLLRVDDPRRHLLDLNLQRIEAELQSRGLYHAANLDRFRHGLEDLVFYARLGERRHRREVFETLESVFNRARVLALGAIDENAAQRAVPVWQRPQDQALPRSVACGRTARADRLP